MDKELFRKTEGLLYDYNNLVTQIELLKMDIEDMKREYAGCGAIEYKEKTGGTNKFNSSVENEVLEKERILKAYSSDLSRKIRLKRRIDAAIENLKHEERKLIELRYTNKRKLSWEQTAYILNFNEDYCRKELRPEIIKKMADMIFYNPYKQERFNV